jgi:hypothetical protein
MSRAAPVLLFLSGDALAHSGHGGLDSHLHVSPEILLAALLIAVWAAMRAR